MKILMFWCFITSTLCAELILPLDVISRISSWNNQLKNAESRLISQNWNSAIIDRTKKCLTELENLIQSFPSNNTFVQSSKQISNLIQQNPFIPMLLSREIPTYFVSIFIPLHSHFADICGSDNDHRSFHFFMKCNFMLNSTIGPVNVSLHPLLRRSRMYDAVSRYPLDLSKVLALKLIDNSSDIQDLQNITFDDVDYLFETITGKLFNLKLLQETDFIVESINKFEGRVMKQIFDRSNYYNQKEFESSASIASHNYYSIKTLKLYGNVTMRTHRIAKRLLNVKNSLSNMGTKMSQFSVLLSILGFVEWDTTVYCCIIWLVMVFMSTQIYRMYGRNLAN